MAIISPFSARQVACPSVCQPFSDDPWKVKSGMKSWVAAKIAESKAKIAARVEIRVFLDISCSLPALNGPDHRAAIARCEISVAPFSKKDYHSDGAQR